MLKAVCRALARGASKSVVGVLPQAPEKDEMHDEKPPRRQAGQREADEESVEACRAGHDIGFEPMKEAGTGAQRDQGTHLGALGLAESKSV